MPGRILIVDDLAVSAKVLAAKLTNEFYDVSTAHDGTSALSTLLRDRPDLMLLDVMMPGMDGFEVCQEIKSSSETAHIPVVMVTALNDVRDRVRGLQAGADDFLSKPVNDTMLFARVNSLIRMKRTFDQWKLHRETSREMGVNLDPDLTVDDGRGASIAVVDTSDIHGSNICDILDGEGHTVDLMSDFVVAADRILDSRPDVVVISLDFDGDEPLHLASQIRSAAETRNTPILLIGDAEDESNLIQGLDLGIDDCVLRPVDDQEIIARVRTQVRRRRYQEFFRRSWNEESPTSLIDPDTGLHSHEYLDPHLQRMLVDAGKSNTPLSVAMIGVRGKNVGADDAETLVGSDLLKEVADLILSNVRGFDLVARYSGDKILVAMPDTDSYVAKSIADRLRVQFGIERGDEYRTQSDKPINVRMVTVSSTGEDASVMLSRAEETLAEA